MEDLTKFYQGAMTEAEKSALVEFQKRINESGEIEPEKTIIQTSDILKMNCNLNLDMQEYHNGELYKSFLSSGKLAACTTPLHLRRYIESETKPSETLNTGSAMHSLILEPEKFEYELFDESEILTELTGEGFTNPRATKKYKEWFSRYTDSDGSLRANVLKKEAFQSMWLLKKKLAADKTVKTLFKGSQPETSFFIEFDHPIARGGNLKVKVRPDAFKTASLEDQKEFGRYGVKVDDIIIISVKTTIDASPSGFLKQCIRLGYNITEAFYHDVVYRFLKHGYIVDDGFRVHTFFLTLEKENNIFTGHYLVRPATEDFIQWGRDEYSKNLNTYINSENLTEGYEAINEGLTICEIDKPKYMN